MLVHFQPWLWCCVGLSDDYHHNLCHTMGTFSCCFRPVHDIVFICSLFFFLASVHVHGTLQLTNYVAIVMEYLPDDGELTCVGYKTTA